tara:strand:+ start:228 stop:470 length:243 start_codon:yes stop_codon:yes gene_type:complete
MNNTKGIWNFQEWVDHSKVMLLEDRFCMWLQDGRIYLKDTHTQRKTSLIEEYNGSEKKGFERALMHFENFIIISKEGWGK